ncbi:YobA family protein [Halalkalibacillus sediminis]|nr:YobA family protein [Halalkalibacillus sediminis]
MNPAEANVEEGYIVDKDKSRILVVGDITREEAIE